MNLPALLAADPLLATLLEIALVATAIAGAVLLALRCTRAAVTRHALARAGVIVLLLTVPLTVAGRWSACGLPLLGSDAAAPQAAQTLALAADEPAPQQTADAVDDPAASAATTKSAATIAPTAGAAAAPGWGIPTTGSLALVLWLLLSAGRAAAEWRAARRIAALVRRCRPLHAPAPQAAVDRIARELRLARAPALLVSDELPCPATIGCRRPVMVLPAALAGRADTAALLRHELAHIALGHPREGVLQCALRILFPWHPLVLAAVRGLGQAQEEVADNAALRAGADASAYARTLVQLAEAAIAIPTAPQALFARGSHPFTRRITRLLAKDKDTAMHTTRSTRLLAAGFVASACWLPFSGRLLPSQEPAAQTKAGAHSGAAFLPLPEGTRWTWRVRTEYPDSPTSEREQTAVVWGDVPLGDEGTCAQVLVGNWCQYLSANEKGVFEHDNAYLGGLRGVDPKGRTRILAAPVGAETRWEWTDHLSYQTEGAALQPDPEQTRVQHTAELVALDEPVQVPAGSFRAAHVRITAVNRGWETPHVRDLWFARGTGIVKELQTGQGTLTRELMAFAAGRVTPRDPARALAARLAADGIDATDAKVEWLPPGQWACHLRGRFALVRRADDVRTFYADADAAPFTPMDVAFWQARLADMELGMPAPPDNLMRSEFGLVHIVQAMTELEAKRRGFTQLQSRGTESQQSLGKQAKEECTVRLAARAADGKLMYLEGHLQQLGGKLGEATFDARLPDSPKQIDRQQQLPGSAPPPRRQG